MCNDRHQTCSRTRAARQCAAMWASGAGAMGWEGAQKWGRFEREAPREAPPLTSSRHARRPRLAALRTFFNGADALGDLSLLLLISAVKMILATLLSTVKQGKHARYKKILMC